MNCTLHQLLLTLLLLSGQAAAPPPLASSASWLDRFLAMDWREALKFSKQLAGEGSSHLEGVSGAVDAIHDFGQSGSSHHVPSPIRSVTSDSLRLSSSDDGQTFDASLHPWHEPLEPMTQSQSSAVIPAVPVVSVRSEQVPDSLAGGSGLRPHALLSKKVKTQRPRASTMELGRFPSAIAVSELYVWRPSPALITEMQNFVLGIDNRLEKDMYPLAFKADIHSTPLFNRKLLSLGSSAYAIQLPSGVVFAKFNMRTIVVSENPHKFTMSIWTLDSNDAPSPALLRGLWGVTSGVKLEVQYSSHAVKYFVARGELGTGQHPKYFERVSNAN